MHFHPPLGARRPRPPPYHGRSFVTLSSQTSGRHLFKRRPPLSREAELDHRPPLTTARRASPSTLTQCHSAILSSFLGLVVACVVARCPALRLPRWNHSPPQPPPPATDVRPHRSRRRAGQPLQSRAHRGSRTIC
jgi:hypothetical protein